VSCQLRKIGILRTDLSRRSEGQLTDAWYGPYDPANSTAGTVREDHFSYDALGNRVGWNYLGSRGWMSFLRRDNGLNQYVSWENNEPEPPLHWGSAVLYDDNFGEPYVYPGNGVTMADGGMVASYSRRLTLWLERSISLSTADGGSSFWCFIFNYDRRKPIKSFRRPN
jgi:hypothetical protein